MGELLSDRANFETIEKFTADNGITYRKVNYPGIDTTGYLSEKRPGVFEKITEDWYKRQKPEDKEPPDVSVRVVGVVKGHYDGQTPSDSFDFKITFRGRVKTTMERAEETMRSTLENALVYGRDNIPALEKATVTVAPGDEQAIDTDLIEGGTRAVSGKLEMVFQSGAWYGYGYPRKVSDFANSIGKPRKLDSSERTI